MSIGPSDMEVIADFDKGQVRRAMGMRSKLQFKREVGKIGIEV